MKTGEIVLIPFPFSELTQTKVRPAVVVSETMDKFTDLILAAVTSQIPSSLSSAEILLQPSSMNGLRILSIIKVDRIFTLKKNKVIKQLGELSRNELIAFKMIFKSLVD